MKEEIHIVPIDTKKLEDIDHISLLQIFDNYRNKDKYLFEPFGTIPIFKYEEALLTDFVYYYLGDEYYDHLRVYSYGITQEKYPHATYYIIANKNIIENNIFKNIQNIKNEIIGALISNILFPFMSSKLSKSINNKLLLVDDIQYIKIFCNLCDVNLFDYTYSFNDYLHNNNIFNWERARIFNKKNNKNFIAYLNHVYNITIMDNQLIYTRHIYNIIYNLLDSYGSIIFQLFLNNFLFYIKYKDSSNLIISSMSTHINDYDNNIEIKFKKYNDVFNVNDFIVEFNYYNQNNNIQINDNNSITINNDQLLKYNNTIKNWARINIYPKTNDINTYRYSGISPVYY